METRSTAQLDYRIFGFTLDGELRTNLYNGPDYPNSGHLYSWLTAKSSGHLAAQLERTWEQPLSDAEWDAIDELEAARFACETCGGSGADPGALDPFGEACPDCSGSGIEPFLVTLRRSLGTWKPSRPASRKTPETVPALRGSGQPVTRPGYTEIGNGLYVRTGRRA